MAKKVLKLPVKLQEFSKSTPVTVLTFYCYIFVMTAIVFIWLHMFEQSCIRAYLGVHTSIITFLCLSRATDCIKKNNKEYLEAQGHLKQVSPTLNSSVLVQQCAKEDYKKWISFHLHSGLLDTSLTNWKVCCACVSPRSLWTRTCWSASPGFSCAASSGLS